jgi:hypothetical protein
MLLTSISLHDLRLSLQAALATEKAGEIVNVRLHWQLPLSEAAPLTLLNVLLQAVDLCDVPLQLGPTTWRVRLSSNARLVHAMGVDDRGRTLIVSIADDADPLAQLTVFGNHGVIRLDHAELTADSLTQDFADRAWSCSLITAFNAVSKTADAER